MKDFGRKTYLNDFHPETPFAEEMKRLTDMVMFNNGTGAHSEYKKPYVSPSYREMEHYRMPFNFAPYDVNYNPFRIDFPPGDDESDEDAYDTVININKKEHPQQCAEDSIGSLGLEPSPEFTLTPGTSVILEASGGMLEAYFWEITTTDPLGLVRFRSIDGKRILTGPGNPRRIEASASACGTGTVTITDTCRRSYTVRFDTGIPCTCPDGTVAMTWDYDNSAGTILQGGSAVVYVEDGYGPFTFTVEGEGYLFLNGKTTYVTSGRNATIFAGGTTCGSAVITVVDFCGTSVTEGVRNTDSGQWVLQYDTLTGDDALYTDECIIGNKKYIDDWCEGALIGECGVNCDGGPYEEHCPRPFMPPGNECWVEGVKEWEWQCL